MLGLSSSCDATVRLTRKASIPEKPGDVKEFDKGKRWNAVLPGGKSDDTMFLPVGKSDAPCGAMCAFGTLRFICHCEALPNRGPRGILCTRGEKEYASIRQPTAACDNRLVKREAYDASPGRDTSLQYPRKILLYLRGEKGANKHKSEHCRPDNAISKAQLSGPPRDTVYPWGKGAHKQKSEHYCLQ